MSTTSSSAAVEVLAIGSELLQGEIADTNTPQIARRLRSIGLELSRVTLVGDVLEDIIAALRDSLSRSRILITTGGLGPTVDDPTREAVAAALGVSTEFHPELWSQIEERFARYGRTPTENNRRQALLPSGALPLENPVGTAPAFIVEVGDRSIISLPGVPAEMVTLLEEHVLPYLRRRYGLETVVCVRVIRTAGLGESAVDERIQDLERLANPTVGLSAHPGRVDIRVVARAQDAVACARMLDSTETTLRARLGPAVYGLDDSTLETTVAHGLARRGWQLAVVEAGTGGALREALAADLPIRGEQRPTPIAAEALEAALARTEIAGVAAAGIGLSLHQEGARFRLDLLIATPEQRDRTEHFYGGSPQNAPGWAVSLALDGLRRRLA